MNLLFFFFFFLFLSLLMECHPNQLLNCYSDVLGILGKMSSLFAIPNNNFVCLLFFWVCWINKYIPYQIDIKSIFNCTILILIQFVRCLHFQFQWTNYVPWSSSKWWFYFIWDIKYELTPKVGDPNCFYFSSFWQNRTKTKTKILEIENRKH